MYIPCQAAICSEGVVEPFVSTLKTIFSSGHLVLYLFVSCFFYLVYDFSTNALNEKTTPAHVSLAEILSNIIAWIYDSSVLGVNNYFSAVIAGYIIVIFGSVVFHEIIILNFCSLDKYTKTKITERSQDEYLSIQEMECLKTDCIENDNEDNDNKVIIES